MSLRYRSAIVTGAAGRRGAAVARRLVAEGARVWLVDVDAERVQRLGRTLGPSARAWPADVTDAAALRALAEAVEQSAGRIDVLVHAARLAALPQPLEGLHEAQFDRLVALHLKALYLLARELVPRWKAQRAATGDGAVWINLLEAPAAAPARRTAWLDALHAASAAATASIAAELAPAGIRVQALSWSANDNGAPGGAPLARDAEAGPEAASAADALARAAVRLCTGEAADPGPGVTPSGAAPAGAQRVPL